MVQPGEEKVHGDLITVCKYQMQWVNKREPYSPWWSPVTEREAMDTQWNALPFIKFHLSMRWNFFTLTMDLDWAIVYIFNYHPWPLALWRKWKQKVTFFPLPPPWTLSCAELTYQSKARSSAGPFALLTTAVMKLSLITFYKIWMKIKNKAKLQFLDGKLNLQMKVLTQDDDQHSS